MDRRAFVAAVASVFAAPLAARSQPGTKIARVGFLAIDDEPRGRQAFLQELAARGYVERRNLQLEYRDAQRKPERFPTLAAELVRLKLDVIVTAGGTAAATAAKQETTSIPIVFTAVGDPIREGLVTSLARPGSLPSRSAKFNSGRDNSTARSAAPWPRVARPRAPASSTSSRSPTGRPTARSGRRG